MSLTAETLYPLLYTVHKVYFTCHFFLGRINQTTLEQVLLLLLKSKEEKKKRHVRILHCISLFSCSFLPYILESSLVLLLLLFGHETALNNGGGLALANALGVLGYRVLDYY